MKSPLPGIGRGGGIVNAKDREEGEYSIMCVFQTFLFLIFHTLFVFVRMDEGTRTYAWNKN